MNDDWTFAAFNNLLNYVQSKTDSRTILLSRSVQFSKLLEQPCLVSQVNSYSCIFHTYLKVAPFFVIDGTYCDVAFVGEFDSVFC